MGYYVYILQSEVDQTFYKGFTENPTQRLLQHNNGEMIYSSRKMPWRIVCVLEYPSKKEALIAERKIKKYDNSRLLVLINSVKNIYKDI
jgi:putative endonuclease